MQSGCRGLCTDNLDPTLRTNTVGLRGFGLAVANLVRVAYADLEGLAGTNRRASGVRWA